MESSKEGAEVRVQHVWAGCGLGGDAPASFLIPPRAFPPYTSPPHTRPPLPSPTLLRASSPVPLPSLDPPSPCLTVKAVLQPLALLLRVRSRPGWPAWTQRR